MWYSWAVREVSYRELDRLSALARGRSRRRVNLNLHPELEDPVQRLFNVMEPGTYVRPHRHPDGRWELFALVRGQAAVLVLDGRGTVLDRVELAPDRSAAVEIAAGEWHTVLALRTGTVLLEVKPGPYRPLTDKDFAPWAPAEGSPEAMDLLARLERAQPGATVRRARGRGGGPGGGSSPGDRFS